MKNRKYQREILTIHDIPPEILQRIFKEYLTLLDIPNWSKPVVRSSRKTFATPVPLTHVCRYWREVACSYPNLWSTIFVLGPSRHAFPLIKLWLKRAGNSSLYLQFYEKLFESSVEEITSATQELISKIFWEKWSFWAHINFTFADIPDANPRRMQEIWSMPPPEGQLEVYTARLVDGRKGERDLTIPLWFRIACSSHLRRLEVGPLCIDSPPENLRELICHEPLTRLRILQLIKLCPRLEKLVVTIREVPGEGNALYLPDGHFIRKELRHLCINDTGRISALPIYNTLTCPRLEFLAAGCNSGESGANEGIYNLIRRSGCSLDTLRGVHVQSMTKEFMVRFFSLPGLQKLASLRINSVNGPFLELLTLPPYSNSSKPGGLLPDLKDLHIAELHAIGWEFSNMVISRLSTLKTIGVASDPSIERVLLSDRLWDHPNITLNVVRFHATTQEAKMSTVMTTEPRAPKIRKLFKIEFDQEFWADFNGRPRLHVLGRITG